ncbi:hypothetical protein QQF64_002826 [Cirrhinus molitorella]|uniref:Uncharacterized protein n=1 Tax=Cirrhinus molitorella TaxID=172907 RepID=A0ABR3MR92_9TELE
MKTGQKRDDRSVSVSGLSLPKSVECLAQRPSATGRTWRPLLQPQRTSQDLQFIEPHLIATLKLSDRHAANLPKELTRAQLRIKQLEMESAKSDIKN